MANATLPFITATQDDPTFPSLPQAYGFNNLVLSNVSAAALDAPMPDYVTAIQRTLGVDESLYVTANVHATITTYNNSIESQRNDEDFWEYYKTLSEVSSLSDKRLVADLYMGPSLGFLFNDLCGLDCSYCFLALLPAKKKDDFAVFRNNALLFDTRRGACTGHWRITSNSMSLVRGSCDQPPLPEISQNVFKHNQLALGLYFMTSLLEYLGPFAGVRNESHWMVPTFSNVVANMYWARVTYLNGYNSWGPNKTVFVNPNPKGIQRSELYYRVEDDRVVWERPSLNPSNVLYIVLAIQPILIFLIFLADILMYTTPIGRGFRLIPLLAGVRIDNLNLLKGASFSGRLKKPLGVMIAVNNPDANEHEHPRIEYFLEDKRKTGSLSRPRRRFPAWRW